MNGVKQGKKGDPIPTKFDEPEERAIRALASENGLTVSEIVRRAARLLRREIEKRTEPEAIVFLVRDLAAPPSNRLADDEGSYQSSPKKIKKLKANPPRPQTDRK